LELVESGNAKDALVVLRNDLCHAPAEDVSALTLLIMCKDQADLYNKANWDGSRGNSRKILLHSVQRKNLKNS
jgi:hypothetical protein